MPVRINAPPLHCSNDRRSPRMSQDVTAANSGSKQKISAARAVDISRWARVSRSPRFKPPASGAVSRYMPRAARASAAAVSQRGRSPSSASAITGASTDETATMNAERDGVVITSPAVCAMNPTATSAPSTAPPESSRPAGSGRTRVPGASASAAMPKRTVRNANGVASARALFTATKLVPHSAVASSSARSAWRRVIGPSGRSCDVSEIAAGGRIGAAGDILGRPLRDHAPARVARSRSQLDHPVGSLHDVEMVLDDEYGVAGIDEPVEHAAQGSDVVEVQPRGRLVEDVELPPATFP